MQTYSPRPYTPEELGIKFKPRHRTTLDKTVQATRTIAELILAGVLGSLALKVLALIFNR